MTHIKVIYQEERWTEDGYSYPEFNLFLEGTFKKVEWDGKILTVKGREIRTHFASDYGCDDIRYLEIDGMIIIDKRDKGYYDWKEVSHD